MEITAEEQQRRELSPKSLELACQRLSEIGYVIFEQVLSFSFMEEVREAFEANASLPEGKEQRDHFLRGPFLDPRIIDNPFALQVIEAAIGPNFFPLYPTAVMKLGVNPDTGTMPKSSGSTETEDICSPNWVWPYP